MSGWCEPRHRVKEAPGALGRRMPLIRLFQASSMGRMADAETPPGLDPKVLHREVVVEAATEHRGKMLHQARVHGFTFFSDEPETLGGENEHPYPLDYFTAAIGL